MLIPPATFRCTSIALLTAAWLTATVRADHPVADGDEAKPGHSTADEVFNEGPRQRAYLMEGMPRVKFPVTTKSPEAQKFVEQGVGQLHGFWYFEAERSFRQAAALDADCGMAYWGMAMANIENLPRARKFMEQCDKHKTGLTERETMYIDALAAFIKPDDEEKDKDNNDRQKERKKRNRAENYARAYEKILYKHPTDLEAKALLALQLWKNKDAGIPVASYLAVDGLLGEVFAAEPVHPAHHFRIHLWDNEQNERALGSAAVCGQTAPGIAHMWHMPGHTYSALKRYDDAAWQQEASARVDHAHMMRDSVMPDQIHNYAHNNEWLIRNMTSLGRVGDALSLAKNMCELPRHPKYNTLDKGSANLGRQRLLDVLRTFEMWDESIALCNSSYLEPTDKENEQIRRLRLLGNAYYRTGRTAQGDEQLADLQQRLTALEAERTKAQTEAETKARDEKKNDEEIAKAKENAGNPLKNRFEFLEKSIAELQGHQAVAAGDFAKGYELLKKAEHDGGYQAMVQYLAGQHDEAIKHAREHAEKNKNEVAPQARYVELLWKADKKDEARVAFEELRKIAGSLDLTTKSALLARLQPIAEALQLPTDWRLPQPAATDVGVRPTLDSLGPFRWEPSLAPNWKLVDVEGRDRSSADYRGKPVVMLFYLGHGCLHCAEQLHAFAKVAAEFHAAGLELIAISSDDAEGLKLSLENYTGDTLPMPLVADPTRDTFKAYRCHDDFENQPLHGTFLVDGDGKIRWQDIGADPFMDPAFVIAEAKRLLGASPNEQPPLTATTAVDAEP